VAVLLCNAKAMARVADVRPAGFWGLWCQLAEGVVVGRNDYALEVVGGIQLCGGVGEGGG
jgi:hypothetical protein